VTEPPEKRSEDWPTYPLTPAAILAEPVPVLDFRENEPATNPPTGPGVALPVMDVTANTPGDRPINARTTTMPSKETNRFICENRTGNYERYLYIVF
jgi:hypothetical protein